MKTGPRWSSAGFRVVDHPGARILARPEVAPWVRFVLEGGQSLHAAAARDRSALELEGRSPLYVIPAKVSESAASRVAGRWAVRHYVRGGTFASRFLGDRYLRSRRVRPYHETRASEAARARGIPTPRVLAAAMYPRGLFYRGDLVTEFLEGTRDLVTALFDTTRKGPGGAAERLDILQAAGTLVRQLGEMGLRHRDLHARNVLLEWQGAAPRPYLLDLDRCEVGPEGTSVSSTPMFQRLRRSLMKWERRTGIRVSEKEWTTLERAAGA